MQQQQLFQEESPLSPAASHLRVRPQFWEKAHTGRSVMTSDICLNALRASHGAAQVVIHSLGASQGTGVGNVHNADMTMYG
jgi:hypothetical protein